MNDLPSTDPAGVPHPADRPVAGHPPDSRAAGRVAEIFKLAGEPTRLRLLMSLAGGECSVSGLIGGFPGVEDQLISRHLGMLRLGGLVDCHKRGSLRIYELTDLGRRVEGSIRRGGLI